MDVLGGFKKCQMSVGYFLDRIRLSRELVQEG